MWILLRDFVQPQSTLTIESTAETLEDSLLGDDPLSGQVYTFGENCIEIAEQIPYHHPSQHRLVALLEYLANSPKLGRADGIRV